MDPALWVEVFCCDIFSCILEIVVHYWCDCTVFSIIQGVLKESSQVP